MGIKQEPFVRYNEEKKQDVITIKLNSEERQELEYMKQVIRQPKDSTAIKQMWGVGAKVILDPKTKKILDTLLNNDRKNRRLGISEYEFNFSQK